MSGGDLRSYIKHNPDAGRLGLVGTAPDVICPTLTLYKLSDVAKGLCYLHSCNVVHRDLKGVHGCSKSRLTVVLIATDQENILVDNIGRARIADFGLTAVTQNPDSVGTISYHDGYTAQWAAPEVLLEGTLSKEGDMFAFAMVMIEVRHVRSVHRMRGFDLPLLCINAGIHWVSSIHWLQTCQSYAGNHGRQAPAKADTSNFHGGFMDIDATLLGP